MIGKDRYTQNEILSIVNRDIPTASLSLFCDAVKRLKIFPIRINGNAFYSAKQAKEIQNEILKSLTR